MFIRVVTTLVMGAVIGWLGSQVIFHASVVSAVGISRGGISLVTAMLGAIAGAIGYQQGWDTKRSRRRAR